MRFPECCPNPVLLKSVGALPPTKSVKSVLDTCSAGLQKMHSNHILQLMLLWHFGTWGCYPGSSISSCSMQLLSTCLQHSWSWWLGNYSTFLDYSWFKLQETFLMSLIAKLGKLAGNALAVVLMVLSITVTFMSVGGYWAAPIVSKHTEHSFQLYKNCFKFIAH